MLTTLKKTAKVGAVVTAASMLAGCWASTFGFFTPSDRSVLPGESVTLEWQVTPIVPPAFIGIFLFGPTYSLFTDDVLVPEVDITGPCDGIISFTCMNEKAEGSVVVAPVKTTAYNFYTEQAFMWTLEGNLFEKFEVQTTDLTRTITVADDGPLSNLPITDPGLQSCIDATGAELISEVTSLDCADMNIADVSGVEWLYYLEVLDLSDNQLVETSVDKLYYQTQLDVLDVSGNPLPCEVQDDLLAHFLETPVQVIEAECVLPPEPEAALPAA